MARRIISFIILFTWLTSHFLQARGAYADNWPELVVDRDGDGLADAVETAGWRNSVGLFTTNPLDPDSDNDGLTDGEEKLFDTNPNSQSSPGVWVEYEDDFQTRQYFHPTNNSEPPNNGGGPSPVKLGGGYLNWKEGGHRRILPEAVVIRRGETFRLHTPPGSALTITKYNPATQTDLNLNSQLCAGSGWDVTVPANGTTGIYTATVTGSLNDSFPIYVIFDLPAPHNGSGFNKVTQSDIDRFLYDDDPADLRDETAVWWIPRETTYDRPCNGDGLPCDNEPYKTTRAFAQAFDLDQFKKYIFRNRVMPAISGFSDPVLAADRLADAVDDEVRVDFNGLTDNVFSALNRNWYPAGNGYIQGKAADEEFKTEGGWGCDVHAAVVSGYSRAAGILARNFQVDWTTSLNVGGAGAFHGESGVGGWNDNSMLVWNNNGGWRVLRAYSVLETNDYYYPWDEDNVHVAPTDITTWGRNRYPDTKGDLIITADSTWDFTDINVTTPFTMDTSGSTNFQNNWEYYWDSRKPHQILRNPMVQVLNDTFWLGDNWTPNDFTPTATSTVYILPTPFPGGSYAENWPVNPTPTGCSPGYPGCPFGGSLTSLDVTRDQPPANIMGSVTDNLADGAKFNGKATPTAVDTNGDKLADAIVVELGLTITTPGNYSVMGDLYDLQNRWIGTATWQGSGGSARLQFNGATGFQGPYTLRDLHLLDNGGLIYDFRIQLNLPPLAGINPVKIGVMSSAGTRGLNITPTLTFSHSTPDADGDGKFDALKIDAGMTVSQAGNYRLEGWLVAANGQLVAWVQSAPVALGVGAQTLSLTFDGRVINDRGLAGPYTIEDMKVLDGNTGAYNVLDKVQETGLSLNYNPNQFETTAVYADNMESGTGQWSSWAGLWNLSSNAFFSAGNAWRANAGSAQNGSLNTVAIDASKHADPILRFQSCVEPSGSANGFIEASTNGSNWTQVGTIPAGSTGTWTTQSLNLGAFEKQNNLQLRFRANTDSGASLKWHIDDVRLNARPAIGDVSITRTPTTPITQTTTVTFTASYTAVDTSLPVTYQWRISGTVVGTNSPTLVHTFDAGQNYPVEVTVSNPYDSATKSIVVGSGIPVTDASFIYNPKPSLVNTTLTFTGSFLPATADDDPTYPVSYSWDFGDGITGTGAIASHSYATGGSYPVELTITNGLGTAVTSTLVSVKEPLTAIAFTLGEGFTTPREGEPVTFSAIFTPATASQPVTYTWKFSDTSPLQLTNSSSISHTFALWGNYTVVLTGTNGYGTPVSYTANIYIDGQPVTSGDFTAVQGPNPSGMQGLFTATYLPAFATSPISYTWDFGDSAITTTTTTTVTHTFPATGTYTVTLTLDNTFGAPVVLQQAVRVPFDDDDDGLSNLLEASLGTNPNNPDTDADGLTDGVEVNGYIYLGYNDHPNYGQLITTLPKNPDTDGDGLNDGDERNLGTHPGDTDTDNDTLNDSDEYDPGGSSRTSPINTDTDADGIPDQVEVGPNPAAPFNSDTDAQIDGADTDADNDGIPDAAEWDTDQKTSTADDLCANKTVDIDNDGIPNCQDNDVDGDGIPNYRDKDADGDITPDAAEGTGDEDNDGIPNFLDKVDPNADDDGDGLKNGQEIALGLNPKSKDSDNDGINDLIEVGPNLNTPLNSDGQGPIDALDTDSDNDNILDANEWDTDQKASATDDLCANKTVDTDGDGIPNCQDNDADGDGIPNYRDTDSDGDSLLDKTEGTGDEDNDGIPNFLDKADPKPSEDKKIFLPLLINN